MRVCRDAQLLLACSEFETFASMMGKAAARTAKAREALRAVCTCAGHIHHDAVFHHCRYRYRHSLTGSGASLSCCGAGGHLTDFMDDEDNVAKVCFAWTATETLWLLVFLLLLFVSFRLCWWAGYYQPTPRVERVPSVCRPCDVAWLSPP